MKRHSGANGTYRLLYLACILAMVLLWSAVFNVLRRVGREEKVSVFVGTYSRDFPAFTAIREARPTYLKAVELSVCPLGDTRFLTYLQVFLEDGGDILILPAGQLEGLRYEAYFSPISMDAVKRFEGLGVLEQDGIAFGLKVHDAVTHDSRISPLDYGVGEKEEDFYLLFNKASCHLGGLSNGEGRDGAVTIAERLLRL